MADTMQFDLVSPERKLASYQASAIRIPAMEGDMTAMPGHTPVITTLRPGILHVDGAEGAADFVVSGGFAEITADTISVLAEQAIPRSEVTQDYIAELRKEAEAAHEAAEPHERDATAKALSDLAQLAEDMV